jgi:hypothetical protein
MRHYCCSKDAAGLVETVNFSIEAIENREENSPLRLNDGRRWQITLEYFCNRSILDQA